MPDNDDDLFLIDVIEKQNQQLANFYSFFSEVLIEIEKSKGLTKHILNKKALPLITKVLNKHLILIRHDN